MCDFGIITGGLTAAMSLAQGFAGFQAGQANAAYAKAEGHIAERSANLQAGQTAKAATYELGQDRANAAASGFGAGTATEALASKATNLGLDIDAILFGGKVAKEQARVGAKRSRQQGIGALLGGVATAAGNVLAIPGVWQTGGGGTITPSYASMAGRGV